MTFFLFIMKHLFLIKRHRDNRFFYDSDEADDDERSEEETQEENDEINYWLQWADDISASHGDI